MLFITFCGEHIMNNRIFHQSVCIKLKNMLVFFRYLETYFWKQEFSKNVIFLVGKLWSWVTIIFTIKTLAKKDNSKIERCVTEKDHWLPGTLLYILCLKISQVSSWCLTLHFTQLFIVSNFYRHLTEIETLKPYREMLLIKNININLIINYMYYNWLLKLRHIDIFKVP